MGAFYMLDCLDNIIGINRICTPEVPISGLYIQDLPGIDLKVSDAIVNSEHASGVRLLKDKITFAKNLMLNEIRANLGNQVRFDTIISNNNIGYVDYNSTLPTEAGKLKGIQFNVNDYPYFEFYLQSISVFATEYKSIDVYVYDLITGQVLDTIPVTTIANTEVNKVVGKKYYSQRKSLNLFICTDSELGHYQAKLNKTHCPGCYHYINNAYTFISYGEINDSTPVLDKNIGAGKSTCGLSVSYSLSCSLEPFMCNMGGLLGMPLLYKTGMAIMDEAINTGRINSLVLTKKEDWAVLRDQFEEQYLASIRSLMLNTKLPDDICFKCNPKIRNVIQTP